MPISISVNGERRAVAEGASVADLLRELGFDSRAVAIERNGSILKRAEHAETELEDGDRLEVVRFVQGG